MSWLAHYHYIFVHFPIALVIMTGVAELIRSIRKDAVHERTANFLLIFALLFLFPTIGTGLLLEDSGVVTLENQLTFEWHESLAYTTLALAIVTVFFRFWLGRGFLYFTFLTLLIFSVIFTAHFGGVMAFDSLSYLPSF